MAWFMLATDFRRTVGELQNSMTRSEFQMWMKWREIYPFGVAVEEQWFAAVMATIANFSKMNWKSIGKRGKMQIIKQYSPSDMTPFKRFGKKKAEYKPKDHEEAKGFLHRMLGR